MSQRPAGVILAPEGRELFNNEPVGYVCLAMGQWFNCDDVQDDGAFLRLTISRDKNGQPLPSQMPVTFLRLPIRFVLCVIEADKPSNVAGFMASLGSAKPE